MTALIESPRAEAGATPLTAQQNTTLQNIAQQKTAQQNTAARTAADRAAKEAPVHVAVWPLALWSEVLPGLWQGGTDDADVVKLGRRQTGISVDDFDFVATLYASANPVDWFVREMRFGFYDSDMSDFDTADLLDIVRVTHRQWKAGNRVLVRCQAGLNRSGLVMALVLIRDGYTPGDAIALIRAKRARMALCNETFEAWLLGTDVTIWRD